MCLMAEKKKIARTTVVLTKRARVILTRYRNSFGQKNVLSVGVELFHKLEDSEKIQLTDESETADQAQSPRAAHELWEAVKAMISEIPETAYQLLSPEQQRQAENVRQALGPSAKTVARRLVAHAQAPKQVPQERKTGTDPGGR
jgi:hypothetical protein